MRFRRMITVGTSVVAMSAMTAGPALAHYCYKSGWNENARAGAGNSQAWMTADGWYGLIAEVREPVLDEETGEQLHPTPACEDALDDFAAHIQSYPDDTLFMGPGLLAGGAVHKGKSAGKSGIGHMDGSFFGPIFVHCFGE